MATFTLIIWRDGQRSFYGTCSQSTHWWFGNYSGWITATTHTVYMRAKRYKCTCADFTFEMYWRESTRGVHQLCAPACDLLCRTEHDMVEI